MRDNRDILEKLKWLAADMEDMEVPGEWLLPVTEAHSIIFRVREDAENKAAEITALRAEVEQNAIDLEEYRRDVERLRTALERIAECKTFTDREYMLGIARTALKEPRT